MFFPPRWEEEDAGVLAPAVKTSHLEVARSPVSYTYKCLTRGTVRTSKHSAVRCCCFIGSGQLGVQATVIHTSVTKRGGHSSAHAQVVAGSELAPFHTRLIGGDVVINAGTTQSSFFVIVLLCWKKILE